jgi:hypothetical protein
LQRDLLRIVKSPPKAGFFSQTFENNRRSRISCSGSSDAVLFNCHALTIPPPAGALTSNAVYPVAE